MHRKAKNQVRQDYNAYCELCAKTIGTFKSDVARQQALATHNIRVHHAKASDVADATYSHAARDIRSRHQHTPISRIKPKGKMWSF